MPGHENPKTKQKYYGYAWLRARIGMVTLEEASDEPSMWQRPSKIPPGSITRQGE
jgi:hypothetical protein